MAGPDRRRPRIEGHRGFRAAWPENTVPGFLAALEAGVDAIELDAGLTRDGVVVVCHDPALTPELARGPDGDWIAEPGPVIVRSTLAELRCYDMGGARPGGRVAHAFTRQHTVDGTRLPTLAEVFAVAARFEATIDVELKTNPRAPDLTASPEALAEAVVAVAETSRLRGRLALRSFDWRGLEYAGLRWPDLALTWLSNAGNDSAAWRGGRAGQLPDSMGGLGAVTWGPDHRQLSRAQVERAHELGLRVVPFTVNSAADMRRLFGWGVDGICTDEVTLAVAVAASYLEPRLGPQRGG